VQNYSGIVLPTTERQNSNLPIYRLVLLHSVRYMYTFSFSCYGLLYDSLRAPLMLVIRPIYTSISGFVFKKGAISL